MKGFPKTIGTAQDVENCLELVRSGTLEASDLIGVLEAIEASGYLHCPIVAISDDRKQVTIRYCFEAKTGIAGNVIINAIQHEDDPDASGGMNSGAAFTVLALEAALPAAETVIKIPIADPFAAMGMTRARLREIREVLNCE